MVSDELWGRAFRWVDNDFGSAKTFSDVVVSITLELECHAFGAKCAEALTGRAVELKVNGVFRKPCGTVSASYFRTCDGSDNAVDVNDVELGMDFFIVLDGWAAEFKNSGVV